MAQPDASRLHQLADGVARHQFSIPIACTMKLQEIQEGESHLGARRTERENRTGSVSHESRYCSFAYSALACFRMGMSGSECKNLDGLATAAAPPYVPTQQTVDRIAEDRVRNQSSSPVGRYRVPDKQY